MSRSTESEYRDYAKDLSQKPTQPTDFKLGDKVTFTNDQGVVFKGHKIIGFAHEGLARRFIHIDTDCYWMPKRADQLTLES